MAAKVHLMEKEDEPVLFEGGWMLNDNQRTYYNLAYFIPPDVPKDRVELGFVSFDEDYLHNTFFPAMMTDVLNSKDNVLRAEANPAAMMIHPVKDSTPWVSSTNWDGGKPGGE